MCYYFARPQCGNRKSAMLKSDLMDDTTNAMFSFSFFPPPFSSCLTIVFLPFPILSPPLSSVSSCPADRGAPSHLCPGLHLLHQRHGGEPGHAEPQGAGGPAERRRPLFADLPHWAVQRVRRSVFLCTWEQNNGKDFTRVYHPFRLQFLDGEPTPKYEQKQRWA